MNFAAPLHERCRWRIAVDGIVQGVGFRPFIFQHAHQHGLAGWVCNTSEGVLIEAEGDGGKLRHFYEGITTNAPPLAHITAVHYEPIPVRGDLTFEIVKSVEHLAVQAAMPPDVALCPDCLRDISDPANRRYRYPFTNCTNCGPRFTITLSVPYDRPRTTMHRFIMCPDCLAEYENPTDRRFHAQPNACPNCGPHLVLDDRADLDDIGAIAEVASLLRDGKIIAIQGLGGYHLACDARNPDAVRLLRARKGRADKPFALMCATVAEIQQYSRLTDEAVKLLNSPAHPIVLMDKVANADIAPEVAPGITTLGMMLPYTPLHHLLMVEFDGPLVMTSGNVSDEPIAYRCDEARERLGHIADHFLSHTRPIHVPCDDSVVSEDDGRTVVIRRARGYVPIPLTITKQPLPQVLACGGDLKNTFCLTKNRSAILSQHLGDLENAVTQEHYHTSIKYFCEFYDVQPEVIACDLHPDYHSTRFAHASQQGKLIGVQHHHAHISSCMADNQLEGQVIGVAFDGTGYGTDGTMWGGEFLIADYVDFTRAAHLRPISLPGGEAAIRKPSRLAYAYLRDAGISPEEICRWLPTLSAMELQTLHVQLARSINTPVTTSIGRLFDGVSALLGICTEVGYEGQAAMQLEGTVQQSDADIFPYTLTQDMHGVLVIDYRELIAALVKALQATQPAHVIAWRFHATLAHMVGDVCDELRERTGLNRAVLSGGVFQNRILSRLVRERLESTHFDVYQHQRVPSNDGGLSLGQAIIAARRYQQQCV